MIDHIKEAMKLAELSQADALHVIARYIVAQTVTQAYRESAGHHFDTHLADMMAKLQHEIDSIKD